MPFEILEKYTSVTVKLALLFFRLFVLQFFLLIRSFTTGSGTFILSLWALQTQLITGFYLFSLIKRSWVLGPPLVFIVEQAIAT